MQHLSGRHSIAMDSLDEEGLPLKLSELESLQAFRDDEEGIESGRLFDTANPKRLRSWSRFRRIFLVCVCCCGWLLALLLFLRPVAHTSFSSAKPSSSNDTSKAPAPGTAIDLDEVLNGAWSSERSEISWISGPNGEDGMLLERSTSAHDFLSVVDVREKMPHTSASPRKILLSSDKFVYNGQEFGIDDAWPSATLDQILVLSARERAWRHSFSGLYWLYDVHTHNFSPLDPTNPQGRVQLALWSPDAKYVVFVRDNDLYLCTIASQKVRRVTQDGGPDVLNGIPDWVYEEEVFSGNSAVWWSADSKFLAFLRTNESSVPTYPVEYFVSRPSGRIPKDGLQYYPETRQIKYPKAGAPNPIVNLKFYDIEKHEVFEVPASGDFDDDDRLITEVLWASGENAVLSKNTNRESSHLRVKLVNVAQRTAQIIRDRDLENVDQGWFEITEKTTYVPKDPKNGRPHPGYIDTVIHDGYDHLAYFTPLDNPEPMMLTSGPWEVVDAPSAVDLQGNLVYFAATKQSSIERHIYSVNLDGTGLQHITNTDSTGYFDAKFSTACGFALISYDGPNVPWQEIRTTPTFRGHLWQFRLQENQGLAAKVNSHAMPQILRSKLKIEDGLELNVLERRPPDFDETKQYPVLFHLYGGPGSQMVSTKFEVDFQAYVASNLGYIVVTCDGRGTGFEGRAARTVIRGHIGYYEARDQISAAKSWSSKPYVDGSRMAIWGWSYGGFMTLKTLELDAGEHFKYGMAVAPVTDWRFYDSIYTERYMRTPQNNLNGYENTSISDMDALKSATRFFIAHGVSDDNVHLQNTLTLLDKLDLAGAENYDTHIFPDSDHSIFFHNANKIIYHKLANWIVNAFNGEWQRIEHATPQD